MKVDTTQIPGYEEMSAEEKLSAVLNFDIEAPAPAVDTSEVERLKAALTKSNSEAASFKKQLREKQSKDEIEAAQAAEERESLIRQVEELTKEKTIKHYETSYMSLGYDAKLARQNAEALQQGNMEIVFENHRSFLEAQKKEAISKAIDTQPGISSGNPIGKETIGDPFMAQVRKYAGLPSK